MRPFRMLAVVFIASLVPGTASAQYKPRTCGLLDGPGCNRHQCGVLDGPGCIAEPPRSFPEGLQLTLTTRASGEATKPDGELNTIGDLFAALRACWTPPAVENAYSGMQISMRFSLNRTGNLIGEPRVTYATRDAGQETRDLYRDAFSRSLRGCMPLALTKGFAGALAGRPIAVRVIDDRDEATNARPPI